MESVYRGTISSWVGVGWRDWNPPHQTHVPAPRAPSLQSQPPLPSKCFWTFTTASESRCRKIERRLGFSPQVAQGKPPRTTPESQRLWQGLGRSLERGLSRGRGGSKPWWEGWRLLSLEESAAQSAGPVLREHRGGPGARPRGPRISAGRASPTPIPSLSSPSCGGTAAPGTSLEDLGRRRGKRAGSRGTGTAACARREQPRRPRSEAAASVRHCELRRGSSHAPRSPRGRVRTAMGHLPTRTRGGRRLLPLLWLFVLLKVGEPPALLAPQRSRPRPRSAGGGRAPGREGPAAGSAGCAAWARALLSLHVRAPGVFEGWGGRTGKFAPSSFPPLCSFTTAGIHIKGGLVR